MKKNLIVLSGLGFLLPVLTLAAAGNTAGGASCLGTQVGIQAIICKIGEILNTIIPILIVLGVVYFVWGVISYMIGADEEQKKKGRDKIIYGIIGLVVIVGMWGLVNVVTDTFGLDNNNVNIKTPCVPGTVC
ncbi:MAG: pilin [bacterium]